MVGGNVFKYTYFDNILCLDEVASLYIDLSKVALGRLE